MSSIRSVQVTEPGGAFQVVTGAPVAPGPGHVRVAVEAVGVCHTDHYFRQGGFPVAWPAVLGHEIAGRVEELGPGIEGWRVGERVAVGWFGGSCGHCDACRGGDFIHCPRIAVPGWQYAGGYADATVVPVDALARIPDALSAVEAAPLGCAGVATFNALRRSSARAGDLVAVLGLGGLGHLGVQFARAMGFETVAIARGRDREGLARELGAHHYVDASDGDVGSALQALGGAHVVLGTTASSAAMAATVDGLRPGGELLVVGAAAEAMEISPFQLIATSRRVHGHPSGTAKDVEDTMRFAALAGVRPRTETYPLERVGEAFDRMLSGDARFRVVLTTGR